MSKTPTGRESSRKQQYTPPPKKSNGTPRDMEVEASPGTDGIGVSADLWHEPLNSCDLTWLAEAAFGDLDQELELVRIGETLRLRKKPVGAKARNDKAEVVLRIHTSSPNKNQLKPVSVSVKLTRKSPTIELSEGKDAIFWTASSVEKFLIPYYETHRMLNETQMSNLKRKLRTEPVLAITHIPPSHWDAIEAPPCMDYRKAFTVHTAADDRDTGVKEESLLDYVNDGAPLPKGTAETKGHAK